ncbi:MAG: hypothetical protein J6U44_00885 [Paludibacteraceae bacterium]|nr:hypothetical protein [Paludibacteraceae bacterium]
MNKELLITLIKKDVNELGIVLEGLLENNNLPKSIINLSIDKAENIAFCLKQLLEENNETTQENPQPINEDIAQPIESSFVQEIEVEKDVKIEIEAKHEEIIVEENIEETPIVLEDKEEVIEVEEELSINITEEKNTEETKVLTVAESVQADISLNEKLQKEDTTLGNIISSQKIEDLKQAISIGDRFRFQRELFNGNGELMNKTIADLNNASSLESALSYVAENFSWDKEDENAKDFLNLLERKFID